MLTFPRRLLLVLLGCLLVATGLLPATALAAGGSSIATAPAGAAGQQEFGNTAVDSAGHLRVCVTGDSWWTLSVTAGDRVTLDYEGGVDYQNVWPVSTTDFNLTSARAASQSHIGDNGQQEVVFVAPRSGVMPLEFMTVADDPFCNRHYAGPGPYDFTAYVQHAVRLALPRVSKLRHSGTLRVAVHTAEGGVISDPALLVDVQLRSRGRWRTIGRAAVVGSVAAVPYTVPARLAGAHLSLRALAHGSAYRRTASQSRRVQITPKPKHRSRGH